VYVDLYLCIVYSVVYIDSIDTVYTDSVCIVYSVVYIDSIDTVYTSSYIDIVTHINTNIHMSIYQKIPVLRHCIYSLYLSLCIYICYLYLIYVVVG